MSDDDRPTGPSDGGQDDGLRLGVERVRRRRGQTELRLRLDNPRTDRALHYVARPRAIVRDDATGAFEVQLTDVGREPIPGAVHLLPTFGRVDPASTALLTVQLPDTIVRMGSTSGPNGEVEVERFELGPHASVEVVVGWSDTAFYPDPRHRDADLPSTQAWERAQARVSVRLE